MSAASWTTTPWESSPPPRKLISETNDNSVVILLSYGTARVLLAGDAEAREEYMVSERFVHEALNGHQGLKPQNKPS